MPRPPLLDVVFSSLAAALTFWLPLSCAGCGALDHALCSGCRRVLAPVPVSREVAPGVNVRSALEFSGATARIIRAFKEEGRITLARDLAPALRAVLRGLPADALVVAVPSSRAAFRRRGFRPVEMLVRRAGHRPTRVLRMRRVPADQRGLDRSARGLNVQGAFTAQSVRGRTMIVVDDVVTTGATLIEAARALRAAGASAVYAVTLAHTPRRGGSEGESKVIIT